MSDEQREAWDRAYSERGELWARRHERSPIGDEGGIVLDLGCGSGKSLEGLKGTIIGADFSIQGLSLAIGKMIDFSPVSCNATHLPFKDAAFDSVVASFVLGHLDAAERKRTLSEIRRILRTGGELDIEVYSVNDERPRNGERSRDGIFHHLFSEDEIRQLLAGLSIVTLEPIRWEQKVGPLKIIRRSSIHAIARKE